jgi:hypothetical protein
LRSLFGWRALLRLKGYSFVGYFIFSFLFSARCCIVVCWFLIAALRPGGPA